MKKHPVDDLFARKLTDWQPKASAQLWERIEARHEKVPRRLGWYWYAAASVAILVLAGYVVWQSEAVEISGSKREVATSEQMKPAIQPESLAKASPSANATGLVSKGESREAISPTQVATQIRTVKVSEQALLVKSNEPVGISEKMEVAAIQREVIAPESLIAANTEATSLQPPAIKSEILKEAFPTLSTGRVVIAHVEIDPHIEDEPRSSKFIRVLRQLKNAKQGEAIEWDEVGFNPKKLMARADERLKNEEEKISKKYQELKDKTNL